MKSLNNYKVDKKAMIRNRYNRIPHLVVNCPADYYKISKKTAICGSSIKIGTNVVLSKSLILDREAL